MNAHFIGLDGGGCDRSSRFVTFLCPLECAPVFGSVVEAMKLAGFCVNENTRTTLKNSYKF